MDTQNFANDPEHVVEADRAHVWHHLIQHKPFETTDPRIIVEGKGLRVWDIKGKEHIDAVSGGVWTVNVGYGRERIGKAIAEQVTKMCFFGGTAGSIPGAQFAEMLIDKMPGMHRVYYANSGSEANEKAFKMVRQISYKHYGGKKQKILYRERDYHGSTIATMSAGGQDERNAQYGPFAPGFVRVPHCLEYRSQDGSLGEEYGAKAAQAIEDVILAEGPDTIGALCLEPITAGGGIIVPPKGYWDRVQEICKKYDILLHIDEVVCGIGRHMVWLSAVWCTTRHRDHGQRCCLWLRRNLVLRDHKPRLRHVQGRHRQNELFPRYLNLWRLHRWTGCGHRKYEDYRRRRPAREFRRNG